MGCEEALDGRRIRFSGCQIDVLGQRQFVEVTWIGNDEYRRIVHPAAPLLAVACEDTNSHALDTAGQIESVRITDGDGETANNGVVARGEHRRGRKAGSFPIRVEDAGKAHSLGVVTPMAKWISTALAEGLDHPCWGKTPRREPAASVGERERSSE